METIALGALLRLMQSISLAAPTILIGVFVAAILQQMVGPERTRRLFGDGTWRSIPVAWLIGMALPVCSLGCLPILYYLRRAGVTSGAILAFAISAPLFNPISILWGLTLSDPVVILTFCLISLIIVTVVGGVADRFVTTPASSAEGANQALGLKRMFGVGLSMTRFLFGSTTLFMAIGLLGVAGLSWLLPRGYLESSAERSDWLAPLFMGAIALPAYETPLTAIVKLGDMFQHGNSVGAALTLLILGAGMNLGLIAWSIFHFGWRATGAFIGTLFFVAVVAGYIVDRPMTPHGIDPVGHTHAFDVYCNPFQADVPMTPPQVVAKWVEGTSSYELIALVALALLGVVGLALRALRWDTTLSTWSGTIATLKYDRELSPRTLLAVSAVGLFCGSIFSCYLFYPPKSEILEEMRLANVEIGSAATSQSWDTIEYWLPIQDAWTRKLEVSLFLRAEEYGPFEQAKLSLLRDKLDLLRHAAEDRDPQQAHAIAMAMTRAYSRMRLAIEDPRAETNPVVAEIPEGQP